MWWGDSRHILSPDILAKELLTLLPEHMLTGGSAEIEMPIAELTRTLEDVSETFLKPVVKALALARPGPPLDNTYTEMARQSYQGREIVVSYRYQIDPDRGSWRFDLRDA